MNADADLKNKLTTATSRNDVQNPIEKPDNTITIKNIVEYYSLEIVLSRHEITASDRFVASLK